MIALSVVITCFEEGELLRRAIESLRRQSDREFEIVIVNDASSDPITNDICRELERGGARLIWREHNGGQSAARNSGYEAMRGDVCVPLDADDTLPEDAIAAIRKTLAAHPDADFVFGDYLRREVERGSVERVDCSVLARGGVLAPETLVSREWIFYGGSPCRKAVWQSLGGYRSEYSYDTQDLDFWMRALTKGFTGYYAGRVIYEWHRASTGMNARASKAAWIRTRAANAAFYDRFGDGLKAREELLRNAISVKAYDCAKLVAAELAARRRASLLARFVARVPSAAVRGAHAAWLGVRKPFSH